MDNKIIQGQCILAGGTVTYTGTLSLSISGYVDKGIYLLQVNASNTTTAPTINLNGKGAKTVFGKDGAALAVGAMVANEYALFVYVAASNGFFLITPYIPISALSWLLNGNTVGAEKWIGTADNFDFPIRANNVEVMRIRASGARVGIGTTTPGSKLEIVDDGTNVSLFSLSNSVWGNQYRMYYIDNAGLISLNTNSYEVFRISASLNIGWHTKDGSAFTVSNIDSASNDENVFQVYGTGFVADHRFFVSAKGNVGIGLDSSPLARLHVVGAGSTGATLAAIFKNSAGTAYININNEGQLQINSFQTTINGAVSGSAVFSQPQSGLTYKEVIIFCNALVGATTAYTFPVAFANTPSIVATNDVAAGVVTTLSATQVVVTGATTNGFIKLIGY